LQAALNISTVYNVYATTGNTIYDVVITPLQLNNSLANSLLNTSNTVFYDAIITALLLQARENIQHYPIHH